MTTKTNQNKEDHVHSTKRTLIHLRKPPVASKHHRDQTLRLLPKVLRGSRVESTSRGEHTTCVGLRWQWLRAQATGPESEPEQPCSLVFWASVLCCAVFV